MGAGSFERVVGAAARRPRAVLAVLGLLCAGAAALALGLQPSAAVSTLAGRSSDSYQATERYRERFGDHSIVVLVRGPLQQLVLTDNLGRLLGLEGCLSGNKPAGEEAPGGARAPRRGRRPRPRERSRGGRASPRRSSAGSRARRSSWSMRSSCATCCS